MTAAPKTRIRSKKMKTKIARKLISTFMALALVICLLPALTLPARAIVTTVTFIDDSPEDINAASGSFVRPIEGKTFTFANGSTAYTPNWFSIDANTTLTGIYASSTRNANNGVDFTVSVAAGHTFDLTGFKFAGNHYAAEPSYTISVYYNGMVTSIPYTAANETLITKSGLTSFNDVTSVTFTSDSYVVFQDLEIDDVKAAPFITSATYDANTGVLAVTGSGMTTGDTIAVNKLTLTGEGGSTCTLTSGNVFATSATNFSVTLNAFDKAAVNQIMNKNGTSSTGGTTYNLAAAEDWDTNTTASLIIADLTGNGITVSNAAPTVTDARISIAGASGTGGAFKIGDTVTATWNNTAAGDNNSATITGVTVDFSQFGGGASVVATNNSETWTATYPIVAGDIDGTNKNVSVTATDNAGTSTTKADTTNATVDNVAPTVTDARISISGASGTGGAYKIGDTVTATWNNTAGGDNNSDTISGVTVNFSQFGGGAAVAASNSAGTWTATYTIVAGVLDTTNRNVSVTATDNAGNAATTADTTNATLDNVAPTVTAARISISGGTGTGGAHKIGDTVTATWNNTAGGDNNSDTISGVTVDFSQFGGGATVVATNSAGTWTATYTIVAGALDTTNRNVSVTATDNAGNSTTTADTTNAAVDSVAPTVTDGNISISGASGTGGAYKIGDTVTATWNNTAGGDNNSDTISVVTVDFSAFGGGAAVAATNSAGTWTATYTIVAGAIDGTNKNVSATAKDNADNSTTRADTTNATVDNVAPTVTDARISISGASGTGGAYKIGDTVTATWNNTAGGDNNADTISGVNVDFSAFGGGAAVAATNSGGTWTATYTITAGTVDATNINVAVTARDNAGNTRTAADTTNATVDNINPTLTIITTGNQTINADNIIINGTADVGATITITGGNVTATGTATGGSYSISVNLNQNALNTLVVIASDAVGNDSAPASVTITQDSTDPIAPTLTMSSDIGNLNNDGVTKTPSQTITVSGETGASVDLDFGDGTAHATGTIAAGTFTAPAHTYAAGRYTISATLTDTAVNVSAAGTKLVVIDTTAPSVTTPSTLTISTTAATNGATVGALTATDATTISGFTDSLRWQLIGGADMSKFTISGANLLINNAGGLSAGSYAVLVYVDDTAGNSNALLITVKVVSGPTVNPASHSYNDTAANDTFPSVMGTIDATANSGSITGYGINGGTLGDTVIDSVTYNVSKASIYGTLYVKSNGSYVYVPTSNAILNEQTAAVPDIFTIEATDSAGTTGNTLTITINGVNDTPTVTAHTFTTNEDTVLNDSLTSYASDAEGNTLSYVLWTGPSHGSLSFNANGTFTYIATADYSGNDGFTWKAYDGTVNSAAITATITITAVNEAPSITSGDPASFAENGTGTVYTATRTDPDAGDTVTWSLDGADKTLFSIDSDGKVTFNAVPNYEDKKDIGADNVYNILVVAKDGGNLTASKDLAITVTNVNEAPAISTSVAISVIEGSTAAFTPAASDPEGSAITWSISGGDDAAKFSIVAGVVTFGTAPSYGTPTDTNTNNSYVLEITAYDGTMTAAKTVTVTVTPQVVYDSTPSGSAVVEVNGVRQDAGTASTTTSGGQTTTTITVDDTKLDKLLESSGEKPTVTLPGIMGSDVVVGELNGQTIKNMETKEATLEIKTETVTYTLPASQINIDAVSALLGSQVELKDINVSVKIAEPPADTVKIIEDTANQGGYQIVVKPVEFEITCTSGDKTISISKFNGYVERTIAIPDGVDPSKITTGIVLNADGTFRHVPTQIVVIDGKYYAKINSLTNSTYSVIWNPVTFTDVTDNWAKTAINDMGSRMVVAGIGDGIFEPDRSITRAEFAAIIVRALGLAKGTAESSFDDVTLTDWFNGDVDTAAAYALISGYDSTSYGPNDLITREQAMTIIANAMKLAGLRISLTDSEVSALLLKYTDGADVSSYARQSAAACLEAGITTGTSATTLSPKDYVTRAEVAVMVQHLLQKSGLI